MSLNLTRLVQSYTHQIILSHPAALPCTKTLFRTIRNTFPKCRLSTKYINYAIALPSFYSLLIFPFQRRWFSSLTSKRSSKHLLISHQREVLETPTQYLAFSHLVYGWLRGWITEGFSEASPSVPRIRRIKALELSWQSHRAHLLNKLQPRQLVRKQSKTKDSSIPHTKGEERGFNHVAVPVVGHFSAPVIGCRLDSTLQGKGVVLNKILHMKNRIEIVGLGTARGIFWNTGKPCWWFFALSLYVPS